MEKELDFTGITELQSYVYRLIDPRNGATFYVGKGKDNRVFAHVKDELEIKDNPSDEDDDNVSAKIKTIKEIRNAGLQVIHVIHRHGMDENTAFEVEGALIDAYPECTNAQGGHGSNDRGPMHATQIIETYKVEEIIFKHEKVMMINVNNSAVNRDGSIYEAVRSSWKLKVERARQAELVLAVSQGIVLDTFVPEKWKATKGKRFEFDGVQAEDSIRAIYNRKRVPESYRKKGAANPIRYTWA